MIKLRDPNEDLFTESRMSFGAHLEELRKVLVRSLIWIAIGCVAGFWGAEKIVEVLQIPLNKAVVKFKKTIAEADLEKSVGYIPPEYLPLLKEGFVPDKVSVDPGQLVEALQTVIPNFAEAVNLDPHGFRAGNFDSEQVKNLCVRFSGRQSNDPTQAARLTALWAELSKDQQAVIQKIADSDLAVSNKSLNRVLQIFNDLLKSEALYKDDSFRGMYEPPGWSISTLLKPAETLPLVAVKEVIENPKTDLDEAIALRRKMNRALIASLFTNEMTDGRLETVAAANLAKDELQTAIVGRNRTVFCLAQGRFTGRPDFGGPVCILRALVVRCCRIVPT